MDSDWFAKNYMGLKEKVKRRVRPTNHQPHGLALFRSAAFLWKNLTFGADHYPLGIRSAQLDAAWLQQQLIDSKKKTGSSLLLLRVLLGDR